MDNILLKLKSVSSIMGFEEGALLILVDEAESHQLSITCDRYMARQLCLRMKHDSRAHKLLPEVLCRLLHLDDAETSSAYELIIYDIIEGEYKVLLVNNALNTCEKYVPAMLYYCRWCRTYLYTSLNRYLNNKALLTKLAVEIWRYPSMH